MPLFGIHTERLPTESVRGQVPARSMPGQACRNDRCGLQLIHPNTGRGIGREIHPGIYGEILSGIGWGVLRGIGRETLPRIGRGHLRFFYATQYEQSGYKEQCYA